MQQVIESTPRQLLAQCLKCHDVFTVYVVAGRLERTDQVREGGLHPCGGRIKLFKGGNP